jgi:hypothetical protein
MIWLVVLCEGQTEAEFVAQVLGPHLQPYGIRAQGILLGKKVRHDTPEAPGGVLRFQPVYRHITSALRSHSADTSFVTTLIDYYKFPDDLEGYAPAVALPTPALRVTALECAIDRAVNDRRFIANVVLHEFEALLLCDVSAIAAEFDEPHRSTIAAALSSEIAAFRPEDVDDTPHGAPSKRILRAARGYRKRRMGPQIAKRIGLDRVRKHCPHFDAWLTRLESLGALSPRPSGSCPLYGSG